MHASIKELVDLHDGAPVAARVAQHAIDCDQCSAELARLTHVRLQLRQMAGFQPPQRSWMAVERALQQPRPAPARAAGGRVAAVLFAVAMLPALLWWGGHRHSAPAFDVGSVDAVPLLVARSQQLEALLRGLPRPAVERAITSAAIDELQARIEVLDLQLSSAQEYGLNRSDAQQLWTARVQLLGSLLRVRYAEQAAHGDFLPTAATGDI